MDFPQFTGRERRDAVLLAEDPQFIPRVDREKLGAGLNQGRACVLVRAEEDRLAKDFAIQLHKRQPEQGDQLRFVVAQRVGELLWPRAGGFDIQVFRRGKSELEPKVRGSLKDRNRGLGHSRKSPDKDSLLAYLHQR